MSPATSDRRSAAEGAHPTAQKHLGRWVPNHLRVFAVFAVVAVVLAACSDSSGKPAADRARTTTTAPTASTSTTMPATTSTAASAPTTSSEPSTTDPPSPSLSPAQAGGSGSGSPDYAAQLKWAQCMQAHGVDVPDPVAPGSGPATQSKVKGATRYVLVGDSSGPNTGSSGGVNPNSPQYIAANNACQSLLPAGSGPSLSGPGDP
jgi:hypothetical protein